MTGLPGLALDLFLSSLATFFLAPMIIHRHNLIPELPGGMLAPAFLQEGFCPSIPAAPGQLHWPLHLWFCPSITVCPSSHSVLSSTFQHPPLHCVSMDANVYFLSPHVHPPSVRMGTLSVPVPLWGWKTFLENSRCSNICK